ncbi:MAG: hypothetical protein ACYDBB_23595 [Armatimonadota bacterium]
MTGPYRSTRIAHWFQRAALLGMCLLLGIISMAAHADILVQTITLRELFNVTHQSQIVTYDLIQAVSSAYLLNDNGQEVPYQIISGGTYGRIAFVSDLPANTTRNFYLWEGRNPAPVNNGVVVDDSSPNYFQITNGLTGVRVPKVYAPLTITPKSPIQGVLFRDGTWSPPASNLTAGAPPTYPVTSINGMTVTFKEEGPIKTIVEVRYDFTAPNTFYGAQQTRPAGPAHYTMTIELQMGQPSIMCEVDTDLDSTSSLSLYDGVQANQLRYKGYEANDPAYGHNADGSLYRPGRLGTNSDGLVDINYNTNVNVYYFTGPTTRKWMAVWDPWCVNTGWYWQLYNTADGADGNLAAIFAGPTSRAIGAGASGAGVYNHTDPDVGISVMTWLRGPDARVFYYLTSYQTIRYAFGLFMGVKGNDLPADLTTIPTVQQQMNIHGGINLDKLVHMTLDYADPTPPFGQMYMERSILNGMISRSRTDTTYFNYLYNTEPQAVTRLVTDMWRDTTGVKTHACADGANNYARTLADILANRNGIYDFQNHYWMGGVQMARYTDAIDQAVPNEYITSTDKTTLKAAGAFFANILWDDDFVPLMTDANGNWTCSLNMGTANMPVMQTGYRDTYALFLSSHPSMAPHVPEVATRTHNTLDSIVNDFGAEIGSPHYAGASIIPTNNLELQQRMIGQTNPFATEPKLAKFAEFYMNLLTPKEVRFGNRRKLVCFGDGSTEGVSLFGEMATGFSTVNATLAARLMGAWNAEGKPHTGMFGSTLFRINEDAASQSPNLSNANFPGYCSIFRNAWDTDNETTVHFINGDFYSDHRHYDWGGVAMYALGAPLSIDWGSMYYPYAPGGYLHNIVVPESTIGTAWDADNPALTAVGTGTWGGSTQDAFESFTNSGHAAAHFSRTNLAWTRHTYSIHPNESTPIIMMRDTFSGTDAGVNKVFSLNLMATGNVTTPAGSVSPIQRLYNYNGGVYQYPSNGTVYTLGTGLSRFTFSGQQFGTAGVTPAIDWDLYTVADSSQQFFIGAWGHNWHPDPDRGQYTGGGTFEERQHILRIKSGQGFKVLMLPYRKGTAPTRTVTQNNGVVTITAGSETTNVADGHYSFQGTNKTILSTFDAASASGYSLSVSGGPTEVVKVGTQITITAHGAAGQRRIGVPSGSWLVQSGTLYYAGGGVWTMDYAGGNPVTAVLITDDIATLTTTVQPAGWSRSAQVQMPSNVIKNGSTIPDVKVEFDLTLSEDRYNVVGGFFSLYNPLGNYTPPSVWVYRPVEIDNNLSVGMEYREGHSVPPRRFTLRAAGRVTSMDYDFVAGKAYHFVLTIAHGDELACAIYDGSTRLGNLMLTSDVSTIMANGQMAAFAGSGSYPLTTTVENVRFSNWDSTFAATMPPPGWSRSEQRLLPSLAVKSGSTAPDVKVEFDITMSQKDFNVVGGFFSLYNPTGGFTSPSWIERPAEITNNVSVGIEYHDGYVCDQPCFSIRAAGEVTRFFYDWVAGRKYHFILTIGGGDELTCSVYDGSTRLGTMLLTADITGVMSNPQMAVFSGTGSFPLTTTVENVDFSVWDPTMAATVTPPGWVRSALRPMASLAVKSGAMVPDVKFEFDMKVNYKGGNDMGGYLAFYTPAGSFTPPAYWYQYPAEVTNYLTVGMEGRSGPRFALRAGGTSAFLNYDFTLDKLYHFVLTVGNGRQLTCAVYDGSTLLGTMFLNQDISSIMVNDEMAVFSGSGSNPLCATVQNLDIRAWNATLTATVAPPVWSRSDQRTIPSLALRNGSTVPNVRVEFDMSTNYKGGNDMGGYFSLYNPNGPFILPDYWYQYPTDVTNYLTIGMEGRNGGPRFALRAGGASAFLNYDFDTTKLYHFVLTVTGGNTLSCTVYDGETQLGVLSLTQYISEIMGNSSMNAFAGSGSYPLRATVKNVVFSNP